MTALTASDLKVSRPSDPEAANNTLYPSDSSTEPNAVCCSSSTQRTVIAFASFCIAGAADPVKPIIFRLILGRTQGNTVITVGEPSDWSFTSVLARWTRAQRFRAALLFRAPFACHFPAVQPASPLPALPSCAEAGAQLSGLDNETPPQVCRQSQPPKYRAGSRIPLHGTLASRRLRKYRCTPAAR